MQLVYVPILKVKNTINTIHAFFIENLLHFIKLPPYNKKYLLNINYLYYTCIFEPTRHPKSQAEDALIYNNLPIFINIVNLYNFFTAFHKLTIY